jgi:hypothetical protein
LIWVVAQLPIEETLCGISTPIEARVIIKTFPSAA